MRRAASFLSAICLFCSLAWLCVASVSAQMAASVGVGDTSLNLSGRTSPNAYVTVSSDSGVVGTVLADSSGNFSQSFPAQNPGITELHISAQDTAGRITDTASLQINLQEHFPTDVSVFLPTSLGLQPLSAVQGRHVEATGQTIPSGVVSIVIDGQVAGTVTSAADGSWDYMVDTTRLPVGSHTVVAKVSDAIGGQSYPTSQYIFEVSAQTSSRLPVRVNQLPPFPLLTAPQITFPAQNAVIHDAALTIAGKGPVRTQIEVWDSSHALGSVWSDFLGNWQLPITLSPGSYSIRARACSNNLCGNFSPAILFTYQSGQLPQQKLQATLDPYAITASSGDQTTIHLQIHYGTIPYSVTANWGDGSALEHLKLSKSTTTLAHTYAEPGKYTGTIVVSDRNGSKQLLYFTVNTLKSPPFANRHHYPWYLFLILALLVLVIIGRSRRTGHHQAKK